MAKKFTPTFLKNLDTRHAGKVYTDAGFTGGSLVARVAKNGAVTFSVKFQDPTVENKSGQRKVRLNDEHPLLKRQGIRAYLKEHDVDDLRQLARDVVQQSRGTEAVYRSGIEAVGMEYVAHRDKTDPYSPGGRRDVIRAIRYAADNWADKPLHKLTKTDAETLMVKVRDEHGPSAAVKAAGLLPSVLSFARRENKSIPDDLFRGLQLNKKSFKPKVREDVLTPAETKLVFETMRAYEALGGVLYSKLDKHMQRDWRSGRPKERVDDKCDSLRLIYFTAARKGEWDQAVWGDIDLEARTWWRPDENRKTGEGHTMRLASPAVAVLKRIKARRIAKGITHGDDDLVFGSLRPGSPRHRQWLDLRATRLAEEKRVTREELVGIGGMFSDTTRWAAWCEIKKMAGIEKAIRIHDIRASRVSHWIFEDKLPEREVAATIGSSDVKVLIRHYARDTADEDRQLERVNSKHDGDLAI